VLQRPWGSGAKLGTTVEGKVVKRRSRGEGEREGEKGMTLELIVQLTRRPLRSVTIRFLYGLPPPPPSFREFVAFPPSSHTPTTLPAL